MSNRSRNLYDERQFESWKFLRMCFFSSSLCKLKTVYIGGRQNNAPHPQRDLIPRMWEYVIMQRGIEAADGIKVASQLNLKQEGPSGLSTEAQRTHRVLKWGGGRQKERPQRWRGQAMGWLIYWLTSPCSEMKGVLRGPGRWELLEAVMSRWTESSLGLQSGAQPCWHPDFSLMRPFLTSDPQHCKIINVWF